MAFCCVLCVSFSHQDEASQLLNESKENWIGKGKFHVMNTPIKQNLSSCRSLLDPQSLCCFYCSLVPMWSTSCFERRWHWFHFSLSLKWSAIEIMLQLKVKSSNKRVLKDIYQLDKVATCNHILNQMKYIYELYFQ